MSRPITLDNIRGKLGLFCFSPRKPYRNSQTILHYFMGKSQPGEVYFQPRLSVEDTLPKSWKIRKEQSNVNETTELPTSSRVHFHLCLVFPTAASWSGLTLWPSCGIYREVQELFLLIITGENLRVKDVINAKMGSQLLIGFASSSFMQGRTLS